MQKLPEKMRLFAYFECQKSTNEKRVSEAGIDHRSLDEGKATTSGFVMVEEHKTV